jgi:4-diphosphocytidyl-2-C-methyl-D-erythritol kinase
VSGSTVEPEDRTVTVRAAAKVNLHLGVARPRPDGYHPLATVY